MSTNTELIARLPKRNENGSLSEVTEEDQQASADVIEALEAEVERLKNALHDKTYDFDGIVIQRNQARKERDALQAQLAAAQGQEPIGFVESAVRGAGGFHARLSSGVFVPAGTQLYTAPIPQQVAEPSVPEGWKLVPIEATPEMIESGAAHQYGSSSSYQNNLDAENTWDSMLAAAPQPKE